MWRVLCSWTYSKSKLHPGGRPPFGLNPGVTASTIITPGDDNEILTQTTYTNATAAPDQWVVDAFITSSELLPQGTEIRITNPAIGGTTYIVPQGGKSEIWLSDLLFFQSVGSPRRTKLNGHTSQDFDFTIVLPSQAADIETTLTFKVVTSSQVPVGSRQGTHPVSSPFVLGESTATVTLTELVVE